MEKDRYIDGYHRPLRLVPRNRCELETDGPIRGKAFDRFALRSEYGAMNHTDRLNSRNAFPCFSIPFRRTPNSAGPSSRRIAPIARWSGGHAFDKKGTRLVCAIIRRDHINAATILEQRNKRPTFDPLEIQWKLENPESNDDEPLRQTRTIQFRFKDKWEYREFTGDSVILGFFQGGPAILRRTRGQQQ